MGLDHRVIGSTNFFFFFFEKQHKHTHTHTQGREKEILTQRHTTTSLKSHHNIDLTIGSLVELCMSLKPKYSSIFGLQNFSQPDQCV